MRNNELDSLNEKEQWKYIQRQVNEYEKKKENDRTRKNTYERKMYVYLLILTQN